MNFYPKPVKLHDCLVNQSDDGVETELFLVEGDSASRTVARVRNRRTQAVLPMQGKPMNPIKASRNAIAKNDLYQNLVACLDAGWDETFRVDAVRYKRVILLFDPDADGIHCGALMLMFFFRWMRPLLDAGRLCVVRPPLYEISSADYADKIYAYSGDHFDKVKVALAAKVIRYKSQRYRGLASMGDETLLRTCLDPQTRHLALLGCDDAEAAIAAFGGKRR